MHAIIKTVFLGLTFALASLAAFAQKAPPAPNFMTKPRGVPDNVEVLQADIGQVGDVTLHASIACPKGPSSTPLPAVIFIHGGGWSKGSQTGNGAFFLAGRGYFTASIEYRLSGVAKWPAQIEDCKLGVRWLRANAAKYNIDPNRIGCMGHSAGGHLVSCLGTMGDITTFDVGAYPGVSSQVQAVVDTDGPIDFVGLDPKAVGAVVRHDGPALKALFGTTYELRPDLWKQASPIFFIQPNDPPFLVIHGDQDKSVPYSQAVEFVAALQKAGVPVQFITVKGGTHMLTPAAGQPPVTPDIPTLQNEIVAFLDKYLKK
jgi:acetyl esterase/lipase